MKFRRQLPTRVKNAPPASRKAVAVSKANAAKGRAKHVPRAAALVVPLQAGRPHSRVRPLQAKGVPHQASLVALLQAIRLDKAAQSVPPGRVVAAVRLVRLLGKLVRRIREVRVIVRAARVARRTAMSPARRAR